MPRMKQGFNFFLRKSFIKWGQYSILSKYPIISFNNFFCSRKQLLKEMSFSFNFDIIATYKEQVWLHHTMKLRWILRIFWTSYLSSYVNFLQGYLFLSFTIYSIVLQIDKNCKSEIFLILLNQFFDHTDVTFKSFSKGASAGSSLILSPFTHLRCFQALELFKVSFSPFSVLMTH